MKEITLRACAKLNLTLDVLQKRPDGYHDIRSIMQMIDLSDEVTVRLCGDAWECSCDSAEIPDGETNLALRAARAFFAAAALPEQGVSIRIEKRIPTQAGLGGGSADAAAVLQALNALFDQRFALPKLAELGASVGSDVPFCVMGGTALAEGRGERLTPLPGMPDCAYVLLKPDFSASTPELYAALDAQPVTAHPDTDGMIGDLSTGDLHGVAAKLGNVFQPVLNTGYPVDVLCDILKEAGALGAALTGSGSVVFGVFEDLPAADHAARLLRGGDYRIFTAQNA